MFLQTAVLRRSLFTTMRRTAPQVVTFSTESEDTPKKKSKGRAAVELNATLTKKEIAMIIQDEHTEMSVAVATTIVNQVFDAIKEVRYFLGPMI